MPQVHPTSNEGRRRRQSVQDPQLGKHAPAPAELTDQFPPVLFVLHTALQQLERPNRRRTPSPDTLPTPPAPGRAHRPPRHPFKPQARHSWPFRGRRARFHVWFPRYGSGTWPPRSPLAHCRPETAYRARLPPTKAAEALPAEQVLALRPPRRQWPAAAALRPAVRVFRSRRRKSGVWRHRLAAVLDGHRRRASHVCARALLAASAWWRTTRQLANFPPSMRGFSQAVPSWGRLEAGQGPCKHLHTAALGLPHALIRS